MKEGVREAPDTFELQRIRLRRPRITDAAAVLEYANDPEVARFADWPLGASLERIESHLKERTVRWESGEEFYWIIVEPTTDNAIGGVACRFDGDEAEIGFLLNRHYWGKGYATIACQAVLGWALSLPGTRRVWATCDTENTASVRVLEKSGMAREAVLTRAVVRPNISGQPRDAFLYSTEQDATQR